MVPVSTVFGAPTAEVSDNGYLYTLSDGNLAADGVTTFSGDGTEVGGANEMFDNDNSTYAGKQNTTGAGGPIGYITVDILRKISDAVVNAHFSAYGLEAGSSHTATLQSSTDNSTWTDLVNVGQTGGGETFKNYGGQITLRYIRLKCAFGGTNVSAGRFYSLRVSKK